MINQWAFTAPSAEATQAGAELLKDGANAIEAMVAAAAAIAVSYPHMNSIGGDGFWLILPRDAQPVGILAGGTSGQNVGPHIWTNGRTERGVGAMLTVPGAVAGWQSALDVDLVGTTSKRPLPELLTHAIDLARSGITVSRSLAETLAAKQDELISAPGFADLFLANGTLAQGDTLKNTDFAGLLEQLAAAGLDDFYRGDIGQHIGKALKSFDAPIDRNDLASYHAERVTPLSTQLSTGTVLNLPAPTQGLASILILAIYDKLRSRCTSPGDHVHLLVEATKHAFTIRDRHIGDPHTTSIDYAACLSDENIDKLAKSVDWSQAAPWPDPGLHADTVWMGALDRSGNMVSYIQSVYWEFGSGVVIPETGMLWNNRGLCFDQDLRGPNAIGPCKVPRHTLNPAAGILDDGRRMVYGTMGGEGQPQTQSAMWWRYVVEGLDAVSAVNAPRWLLGRTWGDESTSLKLERGLSVEIGETMNERGHDPVLIDDRNDLMGHAGLISIGSDGHLEVASDHRSDGEALQGN
ncbi:MAG: gamma-glutamyltranspeptidase [marine bacterium B5-7]|nr:MAG: gamma-glutamyltranspeptidase [marine bacterium B5-7]